MEKSQENKNKKILNFCKAEATGNDFVFIDLTDEINKFVVDQVLKKVSIGDFAKFVADHHLGIGADGVVFLHPPKMSENDYRWEFFNSDGSHADMCGNATRAVTVALNLKNGRTKFKIETATSLIKTELVKENFVETTMAPVKLVKDNIKGNFRGSEVTCTLIDSGVPHAVIKTKSLENLDELEAMAVDLKSQNLFGKGNANVTFVAIKSGEAQAITHERGVEYFTLSCGTGALAAAWWIKTNRPKEWQGSIELPGGVVKVVLGEETKLIGPARVVFAGALYV